MRFGVLGPLAVWTDEGEQVRVPGLKVRALLADLLVHHGHPVSADRLIDDLWGDHAPTNATGALQVRISQLRRTLDDAEPGTRGLVVFRSPGYLLQVEPGAVDATRFTTLIEQARATDDPRGVAARLADALALWRGPALADFADEQFARAAVARLEEQRLAVVEEHAEARLALGEHSPLAGELDDLVMQHPIRERLRAVHMRALYRAGRQNDALDSYGELRRRLADELGLDPTPDLAALHQAILEHDATLAGPPAAAVAALRPTTNLPVPVSELIGRDEAVNAVRSLVAGQRLVTLTGAGGVGKTRLALDAARGLTGPFADGVWLVELAALGRRDGDDATDEVAELVMAVLEIRPASATGEAARDRLTAALRGRRLLLVLDNCEHLVAHVAQLAERLLRAAPDVRILATSRRPLGISGEVLWDVPPLAVPDDATTDPVRLAHSAAVRLFVTRAAAVAPGFDLTTDTGPVVAQLCRRLDGIPLALELAATRVRGLGVHGLVARLDDRFRLLTAGYRGAPPRHQTLTAVIDWSWQLLTAPERRVLRRLAVHAGGCTLAAAEAVCSDEEAPPEQVLDILTHLVDHSLVTVDDRPGDGPRYTLLESVSAYCVDRMREAGELERVRRRHAGHYVDVAEHAEPLLYGGAQRQWMRRLDAENTNMRAALETHVRSGDAARALRLAGAMAWYWFLRGRLAEARRALGAALAVAGAAPALARAKALAFHTGIAGRLGDTDGWPDRVAGVLRAYDEAGDPVGHARAAWFLAPVTVDVGEIEHGGELLRRALAAFRATGDRWGEAAALATTAMLAHVTGDPDALEHDARRSAQIFGQLGDAWGLLQATDWLIGLAEMTGDYERAQRLSQEGLRMAERLGLWSVAARRLSWLGWTAMELGDHVHARECCEQALRLAREQGFQAEETFARLGLAFAARRDGKLDLAEEALRELLAQARLQESEAGEALFLSMVLTELGLLAEQRGDPGTALDLHLEGFDAARRQGAPRDVAWALDGMASALAAAGCHERAATLQGTAAAAWRATGLAASPTERDSINRITATVRAALGEHVFAAAVERGGALTYDEARAVAAPAPCDSA